MKTKVLESDLLDRADLQSIIEQKQNEFLDVFSLYQQTGIVWIRDHLKQKAYELHLLDPSFRFMI